jgi:hypothetical protein
LLNQPQVVVSIVAGSICTLPGRPLAGTSRSFSWSGVEAGASGTGAGGAKALGKLLPFGNGCFPLGDSAVREDAPVDKPMLIEQDMAQLFSDHRLNLSCSDVPAAAGCLRAAPRAWARIGWLQPVVPIASALFVSMGRGQSVVLVVIEKTSEEARVFGVEPDVAGAGIGSELSPGESPDCAVDDPEVLPFVTLPFMTDVTDINRI